MLEPVTKNITVICSQEKAFAIFLEEMQHWWPLHKFTRSAMASKPAATLAVEAKEGGKIIEIESDKTEHLWGTIQTYKPYHSIIMDFHVPHPAETVTERSLVELSFMKMKPEETKMELVQSNWQAFGEQATNCRNGYNGAWDSILEIYANYCQNKTLRAS